MKMNTNFIEKGGEAGAAGAAGEPKEKRIVARATFGLNEVVEQLYFFGFPHTYIPSIIHRRHKLKSK